MAALATSSQLYPQVAFLHGEIPTKTFGNKKLVDNSIKMNVMVEKTNQDATRTPAIII